jgi:hypothetical protein
LLTQLALLDREGLERRRSTACQERRREAAPPNTAYKGRGVDKFSAFATFLWAHIFQATYLLSVVSLNVMRLNWIAHSVTLAAIGHGLGVGASPATSFALREANPLADPATGVSPNPRYGLFDRRDDSQLQRRDCTTAAFPIYCPNQATCCPAGDSCCSASTCCKAGAECISGACYAGVV